MAPTEAQRKSRDKWLSEKVEEIKFRVPMGEKACIQDHAASRGESTNAFILRAVREAMERDNKADGT